MSEMKKGVVLETGPGTVCVLTSHGEFLSLPWSQSSFPAIGDEIAIDITPQKRSFGGWNFLLPLVASFLLFFLSIPLWWSYISPEAGHIVAYVSVDINPSIELGLNQQGNVVSAMGLNEDGVKLLEKLDLIKLPAEKAVELITNKAVLEQYITPDKENTVIIAISNGDKIPEKTIKMENSVKKALEEKKITGSAQVLEVPDDFRDSARNLGVSQGKYVIYMEAVEQGLDLSLEDLKKDSVGKAVKEAGGIPGQIISKAQQDRSTLKEIEKRIEENKKKIEDLKDQKRQFTREGMPGLKPGEGAGQENRGVRTQGNNGRNSEGKQEDLSEKGKPPFSPVNIKSNGKQAQPLIPRGNEEKDKKENDRIQQEQKGKTKNNIPGPKKVLPRHPAFSYRQLPGYLEENLPRGDKGIKEQKGAR